MSIISTMSIMSIEVHVHLVTAPVRGKKTDLLFYFAFVILWKLFSKAHLLRCDAILF